MFISNTLFCNQIYFGYIECKNIACTCFVPATSCAMQLFGDLPTEQTVFLPQSFTGFFESHHKMS